MEPGEPIELGIEIASARFELAALVPIRMRSGYDSGQARDS
jgi:hypothetical protein